MTPTPIRVYTSLMIVAKNMNVEEFEDCKEYSVSLLMPVTH